METKRIKKNILIDVEDIESLLSIIAFGKAIKQAVQAATSDGKVDVFDLFQLTGLLAPAKAAYEQRQNFLKEFKDLSESELDVLTAAVGSIVEDMKFQLIFSGIVQLVQGTILVLDARKAQA